MLNLKTANFIEKTQYLTSCEIEIKINEQVVNYLPMNEIRKIAEANGQTLKEISQEMDQTILSAYRISILKTEIKNTFTVLEKALVAA